MSQDNSNTLHGVVEAPWDNIAQGFRIWCLCGWQSGSSPWLADCAEEFDDHISEAFKK